jgi:ABC-type Co2+ transport system permease subunit
MHIEPGVVDGAKIVLSYATAAASVGLVSKMAFDTIKSDGGIASLAIRSLITTVLVFVFFEVLPHVPVGVSEVHLILGSTLFLIFGAGPAAIGLALGLLVQGLFFEPQDIPQYGMNVTTLIVPLYAMSLLSRQIIAQKTAYTDVKYLQALTLSTTYQGGIVLWVAFWALYGHGFTVQNLVEIGTFGASYMTVIIIEPLIDLAVLAGAKTLRQLQGSPLVQRRLYQAMA